MSGLVVLWVLALLVAYPARTHLRRAALGLGRATDRALRFVALSLRRSLVRAHRSERRRNKRDPGRLVRAHVRFWSALAALGFASLSAALFAAPFDDPGVPALLLFFVALAGAQLSFDLGVLDRPARLARVRPRAQRAATALSSGLVVAVAVGRAALAADAGLGTSLTALLLPLPIAGAVFTVAMLASGARVLAPRARARATFAAYLLVALVRAPVRPLTLAADALIRAFVAPARALARRGTWPTSLGDTTEG
jgi:hypothetical protein